MYTAKGKIDRSDTITNHLPMVRRHALALQVRLPPSVELDDLVQAGLMGLMDAIERFESDQGASFETFASSRVRGAMIDELRSRDWLPRSVRRGSRRIDAAITQLEQRLGRHPSESEIADELGMALAEYHQILADTNNGFLASYDESDTVEGGPSRPDDNVQGFTNPLNATLKADANGQLTRAIAKLPEREQLLLGLYYQEELNLKEIGAVLEVTESRVCQLHSQALARLRGTLGSED